MSPRYSISLAAFFVAGLLIVPGLGSSFAGPAQEDVDQAIRDFENNLRYFDSVVDDSNKVHQAPGYLEKAEQALKKLQELKPDHADLGSYRKRLAEAKEKLAAGLLDPLRRQLESEQQSFQRYESQIEEDRQRGGPIELDGTLVKMRATIERADKILEENPAVLESAPGKEFASQVKKWRADALKKLAEYGLVNEVLKLIHDENPEVESTLQGALRVARSSLDSEDHEQAIESWDKAKRLIQPLRDKKYAAVKEAKEILARYDETAARVEKELKPLIAKTKTSPLLESGADSLQRLLDALEEKNAKGAGHSYRMLEKVVAELRQEWSGIEEVKAFLAKAEPAMERARKEFGIQPEETAGEDKEIPSFPIDYDAPAAVQKELADLNEQLKHYRDAYAEAKKRLGDLNVEKGSSGELCEQISKDCESQADTMIRHARDAEEVAGRLARIDTKHPAVGTMKEAGPKLVKKANQFRRSAAKKCEYAFRIERISNEMDYAEISRGQYEDGAEAAAKACTEVIRHMRTAKEHYAKAVATLPEGHAEADTWLKRVEEWRAEAATKLVETCRSEVTRISQEYDDPNDAAREAKVYLELLREALPEAPENVELGKLLGGAAAARVNAEAEIRKRHDLLEERAAESAGTLKAKYEAFRAEKKPESPDPDDVLGNLDRWKGRYVSFRHEMLGSGAYDWFDDSRGAMWSIKIAPELRDAMKADMKKMDGLVKKMAGKVLVATGFPADQADRYVGAHYFEQTEILCEVTGKTMYTPKREVRDQGGNVIGTVEGVPYAVPEVVLRAVRASRYVIVPGAGNSLDSIRLDGFLP